MYWTRLVLVWPAANLYSASPLKHHPTGKQWCPNPDHYSDSEPVKRSLTLLCWALSRAAEPQILTSFVWCGRRSNHQPPACQANAQPPHYPAAVPCNEGATFLGVRYSLSWSNVFNFECHADVTNVMLTSRRCNVRTDDQLSLSFTVLSVFLLFIWIIIFWNTLGEGGYIIINSTSGFEVGGPFVTLTFCTDCDTAFGLSQITAQGWLIAAGRRLRAVCRG